MSKLKIYTIGCLTGAFIIAGIGISKKELKKNTISSYPSPEINLNEPNIVNAQQIEIIYYGQPLLLQFNKLGIYEFDKELNKYIYKGEGQTVKIEENIYELSSYISNNEKELYYVLKNKDSVKNQYSIYLVFNWIKNQYQEYLKCEQTAEILRREEILYSFAYYYLTGIDKNAMMIGGYKYTLLDNSIKSDVKKLFEEIVYMHTNGVCMSKSNIQELIDKQQKIIKYRLFETGKTDTN